MANEILPLEVMQQFGAIIHAVEDNSVNMRRLTDRVSELNDSHIQIKSAFTHANFELMEMAAVIKKLGNTSEEDFTFLRSQHERHKRRVTLIDQIKMAVCVTALIAVLGWVGLAILTQAKIEVLTGTKAHEAKT